MALRVQKANAGQHSTVPYKAKYFMIMSNDMRET
jgi:hypothetical protein